MPGPEMDIRPDHKLGSRVSRAGGFNQNQLLERRSACVKTSKTECALPWPLNLENSFALTIKLSQPVSGWLHGRMLDAESVISKATDGDQLLSISGKPVVVPGIQAWFKKDAYPTPLQKLYGSMSQTQVDAGGLGWPSISGINNGPDGLPYSKKDLVTMMVDSPRCQRGLMQWGTRRPSLQQSGHFVQFSLSNFQVA